MPSPLASSIEYILSLLRMVSKSKLGVDALGRAGIIYSSGINNASIVPLNGEQMLKTVEYDPAEGITLCFEEDVQHIVRFAVRKDGANFKVYRITQHTPCIGSVYYNVESWEQFQFGYRDLRSSPGLLQELPRMLIEVEKEKQGRVRIDSEIPWCRLSTLLTDAQAEQRYTCILEQPNPVQLVQSQPSN